VVCDAGEDVAEGDLGIEAVHLRGLDKRKDAGGRFAAVVGACEEPVLSAEGDPVELSTTGVFQLPKASAAVLAVGARVAWDNTAKEVTTPAAGRFPIGVAVEATGSGVTSVAVRLDGIATAAA